MTPQDATSLIHLVGFISGIVLYAMLAAMTLRDAPARSLSAGAGGDRIPVATALLGLLWNGGALVMYGTRDFGGGPPPSWVEAIAFAALGLLPAVVVHSALAAREPRAGARMLVVVAYALSGVAAAIQFVAAARHDALPSRAGLLTLTVGYSVIIALLFIGVRRQRGGHRALTAVALAAFAVMAAHLSQHTAGSDTWPVELIGHHASLPLALVILYQDYRFALADIFLKRVLAVLLLVALAVAVYASVVAPYILPHLSGTPQLPWVGALLGLWLGTALAYPFVRRAVDRFVDRVVLRRTDYRELRRLIADQIARRETPTAILDETCTLLAPAISADRIAWLTDVGGAPERDGSFPQPVASVAVPTAERPTYRIEIGHIRDGRRLLSDDLAFLDSIAVLAARRIDAVRVTDERYARDLREREMAQLTTEAELRALRAQLNPHFLFNTLTTIGYLIDTAPRAALETLFRLTGLLRAVLKRSEGEFTTLGEELEIVSSYLAIERVRFEERLSVTIDVPTGLHDVRVPPLVLQPLVENAVKHGIAPLRAGGRIIVAGHLEGVADGARTLCLSVLDTGIGFVAGARRTGDGIGLANLEQRLTRHYGTTARLDIRTAPNVGTTVEVRLPVPPDAPSQRARLTIDGAA